MNNLQVKSSCSACHCEEIEMFFNEAKEPMLFCVECGFVRRPNIDDLYNDFLISA